MMKAWTLSAHGDPARVLQLRDRAVPVPQAQEVLIRCEGFGLNYADVMAVKGLYRDAPPLPSVLGYEVVGVVEAVGSEAPQALIGERVVGLTRFGGYAEYAVTDHRAVAVVPHAISLGEAAALATQGCTAWYAARMLCPLHPGERVLVHSAAGGVGQWLVQLAVRSGCEVYAVASGREKGEHLMALGAHHVIDRSSGDVHGAIRRILGRQRLDVSFNAVGGASFPADMRLLGPAGRLVLYGGAERGGLGPLGTLRFVWRMGLVVPIFLMMKSRSILGVNMLRIAEQKPELLSTCMRGIVAEQEEAGLRAHVHGTYAADQLPTALRDLGAGATMGKLVVRW